MKNQTRKLAPKVWQSTYLLNIALANCLRDITGSLPAFSGGYKLLDVGCGSMPYREVFAPLVSSYTGCDIHSTEDEVVSCSADDLAFEDDSFDLVVCFQVLEHVRRPWIVTQECARVLKPGGLLLLSAPFLFPYHASPHDYYRYTHEGLEELAAQSGLVQCKVESQCQNMVAIFLLLNVYLAQVAGAVRARLFLAPVYPIVQYLLIPFNNVLGLLAGKLVSRKPESQFRGMPGYVNLVMVACKPR